MQKNFIEFLFEQAESEPKNMEDRTIFMKNMNGELVLRDSVLKFFVDAVQQIDELIPIEGAFITGNILKRIYTEKSPVDVNVLLDRSDINDVMHDRLIVVADKINKSIIADTMHPVHLIIRLVDPDNGVKKWMRGHDFVFDIEKDRLVKASPEESDDVKIAFKAILDNQPNEIIFVEKNHKKFYEFISTYDKSSLEQIKAFVKNKLFDLTREANGISEGITEKSFVKAILSDQELDHDKLEEKFVTGEVSEKLALNLLRQEYFYDLLDLIAELKSDRDLNSDFDSELNAKFMEMETKNESEERMTFSEFVLTEDKKHLKKLKSLANLAKPGQAYKRNKANKQDRHENTGLKMRNMQRKKLRQLAAYRELMQSPIEEISDEFSCKNLISRAKDVHSGFWPLTTMQAKWVAFTYHFNLPNRYDRIKRLSNMPMALFKPRRGGYFLVKDERLSGIT